MPSKVKSVLCVHADQAVITYSIKVVKDDQDYNREVDALPDIARVDPDLHAVGHVTHWTELELFHTKGAEWHVGEFDVVKPTNQEATYWWWRLRNTTCGLGGVIFMNYGLKWEGQYTSEICEGVLASLRMAHSVGVLHCDIRASNVLYFRCGWRLIDFGLSCRVNSGTNYDLNSTLAAQARGAGPRVQHFLSRGESFRWEIGDDYEMLFRLLGCLASQL